jgi:hypothetical protein
MRFYRNIFAGISFFKAHQDNIIFISSKEIRI